MQPLFSKPWITQTCGNGDRLPWLWGSGSYRCVILLSFYASESSVWALLQQSRPKYTHYQSYRVSALRGSRASAESDPAELSVLLSLPFGTTWREKKIPQAVGRLIVEAERYESSKKRSNRQDESDKKSVQAVEPVGLFMCSHVVCFLSQMRLDELDRHHLFTIKSVIINHSPHISAADNTAIINIPLRYLHFDLLRPEIWESNVRHIYVFL